MQSLAGGSRIFLRGLMLLVWSLQANANIVPTLVVRAYRASPKALPAKPDSLLQISNAPSHLPTGVGGFIGGRGTGVSGDNYSGVAAGIRVHRLGAVRRSRARRLSLATSQPSPCHRGLSRVAEGVVSPAQHFSPAVAGKMPRRNTVLRKAQHDPPCQRNSRIHGKALSGRGIAIRAVRPRQGLRKTGRAGAPPRKRPWLVQAGLSERSLPGILLAGRRGGPKGREGVCRGRPDPAARLSANGVIAA